MKWYEYRMEVDELHASDELKAKLLAMQANSPSATASVAEKPVHKKTVHFPSRRVLGVAACFAVVACGGWLAFATGHIGWAGSSAASTAAASTSMQYSRSSMMENGIESYSLDTASVYDAAGSGSADAVLTESEAQNSSLDGSTQEAKIIYTANITIESKDYESARAAIEAALNDAGGYMEGSDEYTYTNSARSLSLTLRVPEDSYESFLVALAEAGNVTYKSQQAEDVTASYMDVQTRLENLVAQRTRLQELQAQAETLSDLLEIESSLTDVQSQIESWQSQLDWYDNQVSCCTVYVSLEEVQTYTLTEQSFGERIADAFGSGWANFVEGAQQVTIWAAAAWPVVVIVAAAVVAVVVYRRRVRK